MPNMICYNCGKEFTYTQGETSPVCIYCSAVNYLSQEQSGSRMRRLLNASLSARELFEQEIRQLDAGLAETPADCGLLWNRFLCHLRVRYTEDDKPVFYRRIEQPVTESAFFAPLWQNTPEKDRPALQQEVNKLEAHRQAIEQEYARVAGGFILMVDRGGEETRTLCEKLSDRFRNAGLSYTVLNGDPAMDPRNFVALENASILLLLCDNEDQLSDIRTKSMYERFLLFRQQENAAASVCVCTPSGDMLNLPPILAGASSLSATRLDFNNRLWKQINDTLGTSYSAPDEKYAFGNVQSNNDRTSDGRMTMQELLSRRSEETEKPGCVLSFEQDYMDNEPERGLLSGIINASRTGRQENRQPRAVKNQEKTVPAASRDERDNKPYTPSDDRSAGKPKKLRKSVMITGIGMAAAALAVGAVLAVGPAKQYVKDKRTETENAAAYQNAAVLMEAEDYASAAEAFKALGDYKDAPEREADARAAQEKLEKEAELARIEAENRAAYDNAAGMLTGGDYDGAISAFEALGSYRDSEQMLLKAQTGKQKQTAFDKAMALFSSGSYEEAAREFEALGDFKNAASMAVSAKDAIEAQKQNRFDAAMALYNSGDYEGAAAEFDAMGDFGNAADMAVSARDAAAEKQKQLRYDAAMALYNSGDYEGAAAEFEAMGDFGNAAEMVSSARNAITQAQKQTAFDEAMFLYSTGSYEEAVTAFEALGDFEGAADMISAANDAIRAQKQDRFDAAMELYNTGRYEEAIAAFEALGDFDGASDMISASNDAIRAQIQDRFDAAMELYNAGAYEEAIAAFEALGDFDGAADMISASNDAIRAQIQNRFDAAMELYNAEEYEEAITAFEALGDFDGAADMISASYAAVQAQKQARFDAAMELYNSGNYEDAIAEFDSLGDFGDAAARLEEARIMQTAKLKNEADYAAAVQLLEDERYDDAAAAFEALGDFKDAPAQAAGARKEMENTIAYSSAAALLESGEYEAAAEAFEALGEYKDAPQKLAEANRKLKYAGMPYEGTYAPGNIIELGTFRQEEDGAAAPVEWIVLSSDEDEALLISRYAHNIMPWSVNNENAGWEDSDIRAWLNGEFASAVFGDEQLAASLITDESGDIVTLLTAEKAKEFFADNESRVCEVTEAVRKEFRLPEYTGRARGWWLKDTAPTRGKIFTVSTGGAIPISGSKTNDIQIGVRPVIRVNLHILNGESVNER